MGFEDRKKMIPHAAKIVHLRENYQKELIWTLQ
jgi:hypothetical protein